MEPRILFEDSNVLVIDKPSGMRAHPDMQGGGDTVSEWFQQRYPELKEVGEPQTLPDGTTLLRPGIVHRLDRETSGVMVLAKTQESYEHLKSCFKEKTTKKTYAAFVYGAPKTGSGRIEFAIGRSRKDFRMRSAQPKARGTLREAVTEYEVVASSESHAFLFARPLTGRTHQIRVHLKAIHHPIVCDSLYAPKRQCELGLKRLGLHAFKLRLPMRAGGETEFTAPLPPEFREAALRMGTDEALIAS